MLFRGMIKRFSLLTTAAVFIFTVSSVVSGQTIVTWNFPNNPDNATADGGIAENLTRTISTVGTSAVDFAATGATTNAANATGWNSGSGTKYWKVSFSTSGYNTLSLSSKQRSSNSGPRDFKVQYSLDDITYTDVAGSTVSVANDFTTGVLTNVSLPAVAENQPNVYLRWIMTSNTGVNGSAVMAAGTSRIDDILITGTPIGGNAAPVISDIPDNQTTTPNTPKAITFTVTDTNATCNNVTGASNNQAVVADAGIVIMGGATANCTVTVTPVSGVTSGTAQITLTATDTGMPALTDTETFNLTIFVPPSLVINEIYPGGGNTGAIFNQDFVELRNTGTTAIDLSGYSLQYASASGTSWAVFNFPAGETIDPNDYYLVGLATGANGTPLNTPSNTPDATGGIALGGGGGKVALVSNQTALTGSCPSGAPIIDFVGYGTANCFERGAGGEFSLLGGGTAPAPADNTDSISRVNFADTNDNSVDFVITDPPSPINSDAPTAASVNVGGRVTQAGGRGVFRAKVTMIDQNGAARTAYTNPFGYYRFADVPAGATYIFSVAHRRVRFDQPQRVVSVNTDTAVNFVGN